MKTEVAIFRKPLLEHAETSMTRELVQRNTEHYRGKFCTLLSLPRIGAGEIFLPVYLYRVNIIVLVKFEVSDSPVKLISTTYWFACLYLISLKFLLVSFFWRCFGMWIFRHCFSWSSVWLGIVHIVFARVSSGSGLSCVH